MPPHILEMLDSASASHDRDEHFARASRHTPSRCASTGSAWCPGSTPGRCPPSRTATSGARWPPSCDGGMAGRRRPSPSATSVAAEDCRRRGRAPRTRPARRPAGRRRRPGRRRHRPRPTRRGLGGRGRGREVSVTSYGGSMLIRDARLVAVTEAVPPAPSTYGSTTAASPRSAPACRRRRRRGVRRGRPLADAGPVGPARPPRPVDPRLGPARPRAGAVQRRGASPRCASGSRSGPTCPSSGGATGRPPGPTTPPSPTSTRSTPTSRSC